MPRSASLASFRHISTMALLSILAIDLTLLAADAVVSATGQATMRAALVVGVFRLALLTAAVAAVTATADQMVMALTVIAVCAFNTTCSVFLGHWRGQPETAVVVAVATTMGGAVLLPWGVELQSALVASQLVIVAFGVLAFPAAVSPATLLVLGVGSMAATVYLARELALARVRLATRELENADVRRQADELHDRLEERIVVRTHHLEATAVEFEGLCQAASHDLRPPLRTIAGFSEILRESALHQQRTGSANALQRIVDEARSMGTRIDELLAVVRDTHRSIADSLVAVPGKRRGGVAATPSRARRGPDNATLATVARRARVALGILFVLGVLATATDFFTAASSRAGLLALGAARLLLLAVILAVLPRLSTARAILAAAVLGVCVILVVSPPLGLMRGQFGTALMISCGLCIAAGSFLPWGWRIQLLPVATAVVSVFLTLHPDQWQIIAPQSLVMVASCLAVSVYFALDQQRMQEELARQDAGISQSNDEILALNRELERRVAARETMLEDANRRLESFCEALARDLGPSIAANHEAVASLRSEASGPQPSESSALLERIGNAAVRMEETVDALVRYVALGRVQLLRESVDLSRFAEDAVRRLREREPGRSVDVDIQPGLTAAGDPALLDEALGHLIDNAWKFTGDEEDAEIEIGATTRDSGATTFFVRDNGVGFEMAHVGNLFRPFTRLEAVESFPGHGMGLARAARILEKHGGSIEAVGASGEGAEFRFTIATITGR